MIKYAVNVHRKQIDLIRVETIPEEEKEQKTIVILNSMYLRIDLNRSILYIKI